MVGVEVYPLLECPGPASGGRSDEIRDARLDRPATLLYTLGCGILRADCRQNDLPLPFVLLLDGTVISVPQKPAGCPT